MDLQRMFERVVEQERLVRQYNPAWIVVRVGDGATAELEAERRRLAEEIVRRARAGEDFGALAEEYSDDASSRGRGGDLGIRAPAQSPAAMAGKRQVLAPKLEQVALGLEPDQIAEPVRFKDAWIVLKLVTRQPSRYTTIDAAQRELVQRLKAEQLEKAKATWLKDLRRRTHWEVRR
jgi:peptidyl-prolyl cis-trans isomerase SurA